MLIGFEQKTSPGNFSDATLPDAGTGDRADFLMAGRASYGANFGAARNALAAGMKSAEWGDEPEREVGVRTTVDVLNAEQN